MFGDDGIEMGYVFEDEADFSRRIDVGKTKLSLEVPQEFAEWLSRESFEMDISASALMRSAILIGVPLVKNIRGMDRITVEDIKGGSSGKVIQK